MEPTGKKLPRSVRMRLARRPCRTSNFRRHIHAAVDANTIVHRMEAWMPDTIAHYKLRGFVQDMGGEILENAPGLIRVRLGGPAAHLTRVASIGSAWPGDHNIVDLELHMERTNPHQNNLLQITVLMRPTSRQGFPRSPLAWRAATTSFASCAAIWPEHRSANRNVRAGRCVFHML